MEPYGRSAPPPVSDRSWLIAKVALQLLSLASCAAVLGISASWTWEEGTGAGILTIPVTAVAAAWTTAELIILFLRWRSAPGRGIHPGAHVGVQLILFLLMILALFYSATLWKSVRESIAPCNDWLRNPDDPDWAFQNSTGFNGDSGRRYTSSISVYCPGDFRDKINNAAYRAAVQALIAFCALLWAIHFSLFVRACVETQRRNQNPPLVMVYTTQPMWPAPYRSNHPYGDPYGGVPQRGAKEPNYA